MSLSKFPHTGHWRWSQKVHRDDSYHPNPEVFVGPEVVITEKLDGGNTLLCNGEVYARSTSLPTTHGSFGMVKKYHVWKTLGMGENLSVFGEELFGVHSIEYDAMPENWTFRMFHLREFDQWYSYDRMVDFAGQHGFPTVPAVYRGRFRSVSDITKFFEENIRKPSRLGGECEGFVMRFAQGFFDGEFFMKVAKFVRANHVQTDEHWRENWKPCKLLPPVL